MRNNEAKRERAKNAVGWISLTAWALLMLAALFLLITSCAPIQPGTPRAAMRKHYPDWEMSTEDERAYNEFMRTVPEAQVTPRDPNSPDWCIDQFTGKKKPCDE
jgi:hypothetical protein